MFGYVQCTLDLKSEWRDSDALDTKFCMLEYKIKNTSQKLKNVKAMFEIALVRFDGQCASKIL